jgi:antagonist of KipI
MNGRKLMEGDCIYFTEKTEDNKSFMDNNQWRKGSISQSSLEKSHYFENLMRTTKSVRLHRGPQYSRLSQLEWQAFLETTYIVSPKSDRMGIRLEGSTFRPSEKMDILTDVIAFGAIQLTQDGTPIILMSERQTTGGYAKIANVAYDDLSILAQAKPGDHIEFIEFTNVTENTNKSIYINNRNDLKDLIIWEDMQDLSETIKIALKYENSSAVYQVLVERRAD